MANPIKNVLLVADFNINEEFVKRYIESETNELAPDAKIKSIKANSSDFPLDSMLVSAIVYSKWNLFGDHNFDETTEVLNKMKYYDLILDIGHCCAIKEFSFPIKEIIKPKKHKKIKNLETYYQKKAIKLSIYGLICMFSWNFVMFYVITLFFKDLVVMAQINLLFLVLLSSILLVLLIKCGIDYKNRYKK